MTLNIIEAFIKLSKEGGAIHPIDCDDFTYRYNFKEHRFYQYDELCNEAHDREPTDELLEVYTLDIFKVWVHVSEEMINELVEGMPSLDISTRDSTEAVMAIDSIT